MTYNSVNLPEPVGARFTTRATIKSNKPGIVIADECMAIEDIQHESEQRFQGIVTMPTPGVIGSAVAVCQTFGNSTGGTSGSNVTITLPTAMFFDGEDDINTDPATQTIRARYTGTSLQPIAVS
jgi:hypothetical protein